MRRDLIIPCVHSNTSAFGTTSLSMRMPAHILGLELYGFLKLAIYFPRERLPQLEPQP